MSTQLLTLKQVVIRPTIDTAAYVSGDQIGPAYTEIPDVVYGSGGIAILKNLKIVDYDAEAAPLDVLFWGQQPAVTSVDNAALAITDAEIAIAKLLGYVRIVNADYVAVAGCSIAQYKGIDLVVRANPKVTFVSANPTMNKFNPKGTSIYVTLVSRGTPTYTAATDLQFYLEFQN